MKVSEFDYELPAELVAQHPVAPRDSARLLVHALAAEETRHLRVSDLPDLLAPGDLLVLNDTRVVPARLYGCRRSGGAVELLMLERAGEREWRALVRPARRLRRGEELALEGGLLVARALERGVGPGGRPGAEWLLSIHVFGDPGHDPRDLLASVGRMPLPPYIARGRDDAFRDADRASYQTVYAREEGAIAAPTAGLHFTSGLLERLAARGVERGFVTLHVGLGTFQPVKAERVEEHAMHAERFTLTAQCAAAVVACRARGGRVVAVGTTSVRVLEACAGAGGDLSPRAGETDLFIRPGYRFRAVDALLTNFHLPRSTLLMLVSAFAGRERVLALYAEAVREGYRFYSYGDAMLLLP